MPDVLNISLEIYRRKEKSEGGESGELKRVHGQNVTLEQGDEIRLSVMNVEEIPTKQTCPSCGGNVVGSDEPVYDDEGNVDQKVTRACEKCGAEWS